MGSGTNVQERLIALHHLDAPWRPADVEQREGRILRQGNTNPVVQIYRYVTEGSFDAYMWQTLETKAKFITQVMSGDMTIRRVEKLTNRFGEDVRAGHFAGFDLFLRPGFNDSVEIVLRGKNSYSARVTDTALGTIRSLETTVQGFEERSARLETDINAARKRASELEGRAGQPFEHEGRYHHLAKRQSDIA